MSEISVQGTDLVGEAAKVIDRPIGRRRSDRIVGAARATQEVIDQAMAAARGDLPVVVSGPDIELELPFLAINRRFILAVHAHDAEAPAEIEDVPPPFAQNA